jgi:exonuclease SbcD
MPSFTFIHAADLHLGSPFTGLALKDKEVAERFATASRRAFEELVEQALQMRVAFMVIAGDVYDGDWPDHAIGLFFNKQVARLARAGIPLFLVKGNHDAASIVTKSITLPETVLGFPTRKADTHRLDALKVAVHGRSFQDRAVEENIALTYPDAVPGWFNIGVLHTSCAGSPNHATYAPCSVADLTGRGYDYWALGHVHDHAVLSCDPHIIFPGNLQGRNIRECGPKGAVAVEVVDGRIAEMRRLIVDQARWALVAIDLTDVSETRAALDLVEAAVRPEVEAAEGRLVALRVRLHGQTSLHGHLIAERSQIVAEVEAAAQRCHEDVWLEQVKFATTAPARVREPDTGGLDPAGLLHQLDGDPDFRAEARDLIASILEKMPGGMAEDDAPLLQDELDALCAEAEAMVMSRLSGRAC